MKLLFNENTDDSAELLEVLGFTDADFEFGHLKPYLRSATRDLVQIIGKPNYQILTTQYEDETDSDVLDIARYAVALGAFRQYAPIKDVDYTTNGRVFRRDDHMVGAFEWQIERSDSALERSYYRAVDEIISCIMEDDRFGQSDYMLQFSGLYVPSLAEFQKYVHLNDSHFLYFKLAPSLRLCEQREIMTRLGTFFVALKAEKDNIMFSLVQNICVYFAMMDGIRKLSVQMFPEGLMRVGSNNSKARSTGNQLDIEATALYYERELETLLKSLEAEFAKSQKRAVSGRLLNFGEDDGFVTL